MSLNVSTSSLSSISRISIGCCLSWVLTGGRFITSNRTSWNETFSSFQLHRLYHLVSRIPLLITAQLNWMVTVAVGIQLYHILQIAFWETYSRNLIRPLSNSSSLEAHWPLHHTLLQHHLAAPLVFVQNFEVRGGRAQSLVEAQLHPPTTPADHFNDKASMLLPLILPTKTTPCSLQESLWMVRCPPSSRNPPLQFRLHLLPHFPWLQAILLLKADYLQSL